MSFFDNLSFVMGGDQDIPPAFKTAYAGYAPPAQTMAAPAQTMAEPATTAPTPVWNGLPVGRGMLGLGLNAPVGYNNFNTPSGTITEGAGGGLYAGDTEYNPNASAYGNINPSSYLYDKKDGASNLSAAVQRAQYQDYLNRFAPVENYLVGQVNGRNTKDLGYDVARANQSVLNAGANMQGQQERAMGRFGLQYNGPSVADSNDITGGRVAAMNQARMADEDRALSLMSGSGQPAGGQ